MKEVVEIIIAFAAAWIFYQGLGYAAGTATPIVSVASGSMLHTNGFEQWWTGRGAYYESVGISKQEFQDFQNSNGLDIGDILFVVDTKEIEAGDYKVQFTGDDLKSASIGFGQSDPIVRFEFKPEPGKKFGSFTAENIGRYLTVTLDRKVITSPVIKGAIWQGQGIIEGGFTVDTADLLARQLNAGRLPIPVEIIENRVIGPTLGKESIDASVKAGFIGFIVILLFMIIFYKLPGIVSSVTLILYVVLVLGYLSMFKATLTLPGIAGFLLSIGMAIDANIIIFERLKEEIVWGKTLSAAMEAAFSRAFVAIFDGNATTVVAAAVLYFYGTGPIKGFAVTLTLGILISFFSAVFVTRFLLTQITVKVRDTSLYV